MTHLHDSHGITKKNGLFFEYILEHFSPPLCACGQCHQSVNLSVRDVRYNYFANNCPYANRYKNPSCIEFHLFNGLSAIQAVGALRELKSKTALKYSTSELKDYLSLINSGDINPSSLKSVMKRNNIDAETAKRLMSMKVSGQKNGFYGKRHSEETLRKLAEKNANIPRIVTRPELIVFGMLHALGIEFEFQVPVGRYVCDFRINNLIIEVYGDYWHSNNKMHPSQKKHDEQKEAFLVNNRHDVLVLKESQIINEPRLIVGLLTDAIKNNQDKKI